MITFHPEISMTQALHAADLIDCHLRTDNRGNLVITPNKYRPRAAHTNCNVVKMPRRKHQNLRIIPGPEPAA